MQDEDSTKLGKNTSGSKIYIAGAALLALFAVGANAAGGVAFYQVTGNIAVSAGVALIGALTVMVVIMAYTAGRANLYTWLLHGVGVALMSFAFMHFGQGMQMDANNAARDLELAESEIAASKAEIEMLEKQLEGMTQPADGMDSLAIAAKIKSLKNAPVKGGVLWDKSKGCTVEKYAPSCDVIAAWEAKAAAETARASGTDQAAIQDKIALANSKIVENSRLAKDKKAEIEKKSVFSGNGENSEQILLVISVASAAIFETMLGFMLWLAVTGGKGQKGVFALAKHSPKSISTALAKPAGIVAAVAGTVIAWKESEAKKQASILAIEKQKTVTEMVKAKGVEVVAKCQLEEKRLESEINITESSMKVSVYLKHIPDASLKKLMARAGLAYHDKAGAKLMTNIKRALSMFDAGQATTKRSMSELINARFDLPTAETNGAWKPDPRNGDVSPYVTPDYVLLSLFPALVKLGLVQKSDGKRTRYAWSTVIEARQAVGADTILESDVSSQVEPVKKQVRFEIIKGGKAL